MDAEEAAAEAAAEGAAEGGGERSAGPGTTAEEHHAWALKLWSRMDRDKSGTITAKELNCDEFREVMRYVLAPENRGTLSVSYARAEMNIEQAISFCLRKADVNGDGTLAFDEFKSFLKALKNQNDAKNTANLIFALFDVDSSNTISKEEFRDIFKYFVGRNPTNAEAVEEWMKLDKDGNGTATKAEYIHWLRHSASAAFRQHAPAAEDDGVGSELEGQADGSKSAADLRMLKGIKKPDADFLPMLRKITQPIWRAPWNERLNPVPIAELNPMEAAHRKHYFSKSASLPELQRRLKQSGSPRHQKLAKRLARPAVPHNPGEPPGKERHMPDGRMRGSRGEVVPWSNTWQTPEVLKIKRPDPASLLLRCPGEPPEWIKMGKTTKPRAVPLPIRGGLSPTPVM